MNEGWVKYTGDNPPTDTRRILQTHWKGIGHDVLWFPGWDTDREWDSLVAYRYHSSNPYVEMPEVAYLDDDGTWYHDPRVSGFFYARYRRCVEKEIVRGEGDKHDRWICECGASWWSHHGNLCPACGAEGKS